MKVYIIRHGEVPHNVLKLYNNEDEDLTKRGIFQALELKNKIEDIDYDLIISSPLLRARHTAKLINIHNKDIIIDNRLEERNPGNLNGKSIHFTNREEYWNYNSNIQYGTSEDIRLFFKRVYNFLDELKNEDYKVVIVVAHSGVSRAFSTYFYGMGDGKLLERGLKNCEIKEYEL